MTPRVLVPGHSSPEISLSQIFSLDSQEEISPEISLSQIFSLDSQEEIFFRYIRMSFHFFQHHQVTFTFSQFLASQEFSVCINVTDTPDTLKPPPQPIPLGRLLTSDRLKEN